ncbi:MULTISPECIES: hypothetical protein [Cyanophyceae]|nr:MULTISPECIES: hypothetical protein [Cyanophyceae]MBD1918368.1 hypothetical protein [Phormidium sp. FACHB-77]MBD2028763.1 hypothetical protein [Phormidium sp. FACHB-322]MBD2051184.1 hypothetical protein [Leptolyngbya sp. FACHB-60]
MTLDTITQSVTLGIPTPLVNLLTATGLMTLDTIMPRVVMLEVALAPVSR